jgi:hypothetical protein
VPAVDVLPPVPGELLPALPGALLPALPGEPVPAVPVPRDVLELPQAETHNKAAAEIRPKCDLKDVMIAPA